MNRREEFSEWFREFFDEYYYETYRVYEPESRNESEARFIVDALDLPKGSSILDIGCGYARHAVYLARWGYRVVGIDLSSFLLNKARERCRNFGVNVKLLQMDMRSMDFYEEFDGAYIFYTTYGYFSDGENLKVLENIHRALRKGGRVLIDIWNKVHTYARFYNSRNDTICTWYYSGNYLILEEMKLDILNDRVNSKRRFFKDSCEVTSKAFSLRLYSLREMIEMFNHVGFRLLKTFGSYKGEDYRITSPRLIIVAEK